MSDSPKDESQLPEYVAPGEGSSAHCCYDCGAREYIKIIHDGTGRYVCAFGCPDEDDGDVPARDLPAVRELLSKPSVLDVSSILTCTTCGGKIGDDPAVPYRIAHRSPCTDGL